MQDQLLQEIRAYAHDLQAYIQTYRLPKEWFVQPDHLAVKCRDAAHFEGTLKMCTPIAKRISYVELDNRRLASVELSSIVQVGGIGSVYWLEVMEPRPERAGNDVVGMEHMEFLYPNFEAATSILAQNNIPFELQSNIGHAWLNMVINEKGQELKLNNGLLADIVAQNHAAGTAQNYPVR